jgi:Heparinase II/III N-terminus/Heparinase II/III-like protein
VSVTRRAIALAVRVRQECEKIAASVRPPQPALTPAGWSRVWNAGSGPLAQSATPALSHLREAMRQRFPRAHLRARDLTHLPDRQALLAAAERVLAGHWDVFGAAPRMNGGIPEWSTHPISGVEADNAPWPRVRFLEGIGGGDVKHIWELNRHHHLLRLAQAYWLTRDDRFPRRMVALLEDWMRANPPGRGINWTASLEVSFRAVVWCWLFALTCDSTEWTESSCRKFLWQLWHHAKHVERFDSTHHSPNTHLTGEALGLVYVGVMFPEFARAERWKHRGIRILADEIAHQILTDGTHFERATGYHRYTLEFYLHLVALGRGARIPLPPAVLPALTTLLGASAALRRSESEWPVIGDEDSGSMLPLAVGDSHDQRPLLVAGAALSREPRWLEGAHVQQRALAFWLVDDDAFRWLADQPSRPLRPRHDALPAAGYYVGRDGEGATSWSCLVDAGPHGGDRTGHAHTDLGHVEVSQGGEAIVTDFGSPRYTGDPLGRGWYRSEEAHACFVVTGEPLAVPRNDFGWRVTAPTPSVAHGVTGGVWWCRLAYRRSSRGGAIDVERLVLLIPGSGVVVCDWIDGAEGRDCALHWPLASAGGVLDDARSELRLDASVMRWWAAPGLAHLSAIHERVRRSPRYGEEVDAGMLRLRWPGVQTAALVTAIAAADARIEVAPAAAGGWTVASHSPRGSFSLACPRRTPPEVTVPNVAGTTVGGWA